MVYEILPVWNDRWRGNAGIKLYSYIVQSLFASFGLSIFPDIPACSDEGWIVN